MHADRGEGRYEEQDGGCPGRDMPGGAWFFHFLSYNYSPLYFVSFRLLSYCSPFHDVFLLAIQCITDIFLVLFSYRSLLLLGFIPPPPKYLTTNICSFEPYPSRSLCLPTSIPNTKSHCSYPSYGHPFLQHLSRYGTASFLFPRWKGK